MQGANCRKRADNHPHRVGVVAKLREQLRHVLVNICVCLDPRLVLKVLFAPLFVLRRSGQFAVNQEEGDLQIVAFFG